MQLQKRAERSHVVIWKDGIIACNCTDDPRKAVDVGRKGADGERDDKREMYLQVAKAPWVDVKRLSKAWKEAWGASPQPGKRGRGLGIGRIEEACTNIKWSGGLPPARRSVRPSQKQAWNGRRHRVRMGNQDGTGWVGVGLGRVR